MPKSTRDLYLDHANDHNRRAEARRAAEARYARLNPSFASKAWSATSGLVSAGINKITGKTAREAAKAAKCEEIESFFKEGVSNINVNWNRKSGTQDGVPYSITQIKKHMVGMGGIITDIEDTERFDFTDPSTFKRMLGQVLRRGNELLTTSASMTDAHPQRDATFNANVEHAYLGTVHFFTLIEMFKKCLPYFEFMDDFMDQPWKECKFEHKLTDQIRDINRLRKHLRDIIMDQDQGVMHQLEELKTRLNLAHFGKHNPPRDGGKRRTRRHRSRRNRSRRHRTN